jgi:hypothetical protein
MAVVSRYQSSPVPKGEGPGAPVNICGTGDTINICGAGGTISLLG